MISFIIMIFLSALMVLFFRKRVAPMNRMKYGVFAGIVGIGYVTVVSGFIYFSIQGYHADLSAMGIQPEEGDIELAAEYSVYMILVVNITVICFSISHSFLALKRLRDCQWHGAFAWILVVPLLNILLMILLVFPKEGQRQTSLETAQVFD